jgi:hypothetical protein
MNRENGLDRVRRHQATHQPGPPPKLPGYHSPLTRGRLMGVPVLRAAWELRII